MSLIERRRRKWVTVHKPTKNEIADLLAIVNRDLAESQVEGRTLDWRLAIAYNAALQAATAALAAAGYRAARGDHHRRAIESLTWNAPDFREIGFLDSLPPQPHTSKRFVESRLTIKDERRI